MKKKQQWGDLFTYLPEVLRIMRLSLFLILISTTIAFSSNSYSQVTKFSIDLDKVTVEDVIKSIEEESEFIFLYQKQHVDLERKVSVHVLDEDINEVLNQLFAGTDNTYVINDRQIVIGKKNSNELEKSTPKTLNTDSESKIPQKKEITGKVVDVEGLALPGVSVVVKGTTIGTVTNTEGEFSLSVPQDAEILQFSFVGMKPQEITIGNVTNFNVELKEETIGLEEVVAVGYGVQKKVNLTGAVSSVNFESEALTSRPVSNVSVALSGLTSGIRVQQVNGLPSDDDNANIQIRGTGSLNASSSPLVVVDGQVAEFNSVSPNDVASISILKDAASAAIYGSRASNGVILITTKSGKDTNGKITFNYNSYVGSSTYANKEDINSSTPDYMIFMNMIRSNSGLSQKFSEEYINEWREGSKTDPIYYPNTNWWEAITKQNITMNHHFSATGGNQKLKFYSAVEYFDDDGLVPNTGFKKYTFRNNLEYKVNDWLKLGSNITTIRTKAEPASIDDAFQWFRATTPGIVPKHLDGRYGAGQILAGEGGNNNLLANVETQKGETKRFQLQNKIYGVITPLKGLSVTGSYFNDLTQTEAWSGGVPVDRWNFQTNQIEIDKTTGSTLSISNSYNKRERNVVDLYADYSLTFGEHNLYLLGGFNQESYAYNRFSASRNNLLSYDTPVLDAAASDQQNSGTAYDFSLRSFFGRITYNYKSKYFLETNFRYDGSSKFAPENRWGFFPSFSAGWLISGEDFWQPLANTFDYFKLRGSWGQLGNNGIGNYEWQNFYQPANYVLNDVAVQGLNFDSFGNSNITWETTDVMNIGVDMRLLNSLSFNVNYYNKFTHNILATLPIPYVNGGISAPRVNSAEVRNTGFETEVGYSKKIGKLSIAANFNFGYNKNRIEKYKGDLIEPHGNYQVWTEGQPIGIYWVREVDHIVQDITEIDNMVTDGYTFSPQTPGEGDFLYKNNTDDKAINDDDRVLKGNPIPLFTYGGNINVKYAGFDFSLYFDGVGGWDRYLDGSTYSLKHLEEYQFPKEYLKAWTVDNPSVTIPKIYNGSEVNNQVSDYFLRSAAYMKIRSIQLGYTLPLTLVQSIKLEQVRVFANVENYFTFTHWPTMDPEMAVSQYDQTYPLSKTISFGLSVSF